MRLLVAYVRRSRRTQVEQALRREMVSGWSESLVQGHGTAAAGHATEHVRIEALVEEERAASVADALAAAASTGQVGDGLVLAVPVVFAQRIGGGDAEEKS